MAASLGLVGQARPASLPAVQSSVPPTAVAQSTAVGYGGAVVTVDLAASRTAIDVLKAGGNAMDAAVASAATLGVTEPYVAGIGGGGFLVHYSAGGFQKELIRGHPDLTEPDG